MSRLRLLLAALVVTLSACGDVMTSYYKSISTTAISASACRDLLSEAHEKKTAAVSALAKAGNPSGAQVELDGWLPKYDKVKLACTSLKVGAKLALDAAPSVAAAVSRDKDVAAWIARLVKLGFEAAGALSEVGLKLPGVN